MKARCGSVNSVEVDSCLWQHSSRSSLEACHTLTLKPLVVMYFPWFDFFPFTCISLFPISSCFYLSAVVYDTASSDISTVSSYSSLLQVGGEKSEYASLS